MEDASDTRIQVNLILVELFWKYVPVHYLGVVSLGLDWQLNKDTTVDVVERQEFFPCSRCEFLLIVKLTEIRLFKHVL
jgi:hypothetical protein